MKKFYYKAGIFPHNCSNYSFELDVREGCYGIPYDTAEEALAVCKDLGFRRVFEVDDDGSWRAVVGYAPNGSHINDADWEQISKSTLTLVSHIPQKKLTELLKNNVF